MKPLNSVAHAVQRRLRRRRYEWLSNAVGLDQIDGPILDLGGGPGSFFCEFYPDLDRVTLLENREQAVARAKARHPGLNVVLGDGTAMGFDDNAFDLVVCNSVIEHVADQEALAREIRRVGRSYFVQTPNGRFPLETHAPIGVPLLPWLPGVRLKKLACKVLRANWGFVQSVRYTSAPALRSMFPDGELSYESLRKSFYVVKRA